jgi:hypothetical protein
LDQPLVEVGLRSVPIRTAQITHLETAARLVAGQAVQTHTGALELLLIKRHAVPGVAEIAPIQLHNQRAFLWKGSHRRDEDGVRSVSKRFRQNQVAIIVDGQASLNGLKWLPAAGIGKEQKLASFQTQAGRRQHIAQKRSRFLVASHWHVQRSQLVRQLALHATTPAGHHHRPTITIKGEHNTPSRQRGDDIRAASVIHNDALRGGLQRQHTLVVRVQPGLGIQFPDITVGICHEQRATRSGRGIDRQPGLTIRPAFRQPGGRVDHTPQGITGLGKKQQAAVGAVHHHQVIACTDRQSNRRMQLAIEGLACGYIRKRTIDWYLIQSTGSWKKARGRPTGLPEQYSALLRISKKDRVVPDSHPMGQGKAAKAPLFICQRGRGALVGSQPYSTPAQHDPLAANQAVGALAVFIRGH